MSPPAARPRHTPPLVASVGARTRMRSARGRARARRIAAHLVGHLGQKLGREGHDLTIVISLRLELAVDRLGQDSHRAILLDERFGLTAVSLVLVSLYVLHDLTLAVRPAGSAASWLHPPCHAQAREWAGWFGWSRTRFDSGGA